MKVRVAKYLASCGLGSRRKCEELVSAGRVKVNGEMLSSPAFNVEPGVDRVELDGKLVKPQNKVYYLLNKPAGYTCSLSDEHADKLVNELVPDSESVWPVGRLDRDTSGLIILTNDGDLTQHLTHPKFEKTKTYKATVDKPLSDEQLVELQNGIELDDGRIKPDEVKPLGGGNYEITVHEGRNRLIRRIFEHFDRQVMTLARTKLAFLELGGLKPGEYRALNKKEIEGLKHA